MEDYKKTIETLETTPEEEMINTEEDDELLQETDQIDDLTISTVGLEESSDIVLDIPTDLQMPQGAKQPDPSLSTQTQAVEPILQIPTYDEIRRDTVNRQAIEVGFRNFNSKNTYL
jgi:hypothetical protein